MSPFFNGKRAVLPTVTDGLPSAKMICTAFGVPLWPPLTPHGRNLFRPKVDVMKPPSSLRMR
jgi:hypothetical protein